MENSKKKPGSLVTPKKNRSLDLKSLYSSEVFEVGGNEQKVSVENDQEKAKNHKRESGREASLSRFGSDAKKGRKDGLIGVNQNIVHGHKSDLTEALKGIPLSLGQKGSGFSIPKRPRGTARRKKTESDKICKPVDHIGSSGEDNIISSEDAGPLNRLALSFAVSAVNNDQSTKSGKQVIVTNTPSKKTDSGPASNSVTSNSKLKRKAGVREFNETLNSHEEKALTMVGNPDGTSSKKPRKKFGKKDIVAVRDDKNHLRKISEPSADCSNEDGVFIDILDGDDDDEENLEKNAARMLSSRFDPSCTGFSLKRTTLRKKANRLSSPVPLPRDSINQEPFASGGGEYDEAENNRALRPRREDKGRIASRKRRHFYELTSCELDSRWMLKRRIKIFWPLDESWYHGLVNDYHSESKLHHIKYDDKDEEWVDLQKEKFKLLLLPSEFPGKRKSKKQSRGTKDPHLSPEKVKSDGVNTLDLEPIASWVTSSSQRVKALHRSLKSQMASQMHQPLNSSLLPEKADKPESMVATSDNIKTTISYKSAVEGSLAVRGVIDKSVLETASIPHNGEHVVYFRRKFRKRAGNFSFPRDVNACGNCLAPVTVGFSAMGGKTPCYDSIDWSLNYKKFKLLVCLPSFCFLEFSLGKRDLQLIHDIMMLQHGVLACTSPAVVLEMFSIDTNRGLRFLLYDGSLKQALAFVFRILVLLDEVVDPCDGNMNLPATSLRFGFSRPQNRMEQDVFSLAIYSFARLPSSKWCRLESEILRDLILIKQLPAADCTYDSMKELECDHLDQKKFHVDLELFLKKGSEKKFASVGASAEASNANLERDIQDEPPFSSAPNTFLNLHLHSLMANCVALHHSPESSGPGAETAEFSRSDPMSIITQGVSVNQEDETMEKEDTDVMGLSGSDPVLGREVSSDDNVIDKSISSEKLQNMDQVDNEKDVKVNEDTVTLHEFVPISTPSRITNPAAIPLGPPNDSTSANILSSDDGLVWKQSLSSTCDGKTQFHDGFIRGPKRPRTQVQYTLPFTAYDISARQKTKNQRSLPCKRIRRASLKRISYDGSRETEKKLDSFVIDANVLVTYGDQGWRECGAQVLLELADHNEWRISVKLSGVVKYSYKVKHMMQPGSTNRFTYAMMWKGGKDWVLEFSDRSQWSIFKDMYEECYNRNIRAASVKNIPIPGVQLVEESSHYETEVPFVRNPTMYIRQFQNDVERALDPSRVTYEMDSDDEQWLMDNRKLNEGDISEDYFEKIMDMLEKVSFVQLRDKFTETEIEEHLQGTGSLEAAKLIHEYWLQKRERKRMPLIRHLQPPLWEIYQHQLKDWEQHTVGRSNVALSVGPDKAPSSEKPQVFAFCLKPRGLEVPNKVPRQRPQRRLSVTTHHHSSYADQDGALSLVSGRRSKRYAFEDEKMLYSTTVHYSSDASPAVRSSTRVLSPASNKDHDWNPYRKVFKKRGRKSGRKPSFSTQHAKPYNDRNRNGVKQQKMVLLESSAQGQYAQDVGVDDHLNDSYLEELRVRDAENTAKLARNTAKMKRERAQRLFMEAEKAMHKAAIALMNAEAMKGPCVDSNGGVN